MSHQRYQPRSWITPINTLSAAKAPAPNTIVPAGVGTVPAKLPMSASSAPTVISPQRRRWLRANVSRSLSRCSVPASSVQPRMRVAREGRERGASNPVTTECYCETVRCSNFSARREERGEGLLGPAGAELVEQRAGALAGGARPGGVPQGVERIAQIALDLGLRVERDADAGQLARVLEQARRPRQVCAGSGHRGLDTLDFGDSRGEAD